ncbi:MAG: hypothetical protein RL582_1720, partial [Bacteroidota bacterium]
MFHKYNLTPQQLSFIAALLLSVPVALGFSYFAISWWTPYILFILMMIFSYTLISLILNQFLYRQIRLIYKMISQTKATKREEFYNKNILPTKSIDEVRKDVK